MRPPVSSFVCSPSTCAAASSSFFSSCFCFLSTNASQTLKFRNSPRFFASLTLLIFFTVCTSSLNPSKCTHSSHDLSYLFPVTGVCAIANQLTINMLNHRSSPKPSNDRIYVLALANLYLF
ncbi:hypothetical protein BJ508DRAFT_49236 [Ascobolus immersus RN42]|uniref:Uncharacterized protein n=1 Tax=Ascobolus immersus RN42 TaxID=1160509 RepID=A0A3N4HHT3_ASCIM|nr:hypothetical protein BJ508DRAFT_49236 [Ascobolus immersus RN42]